MPDTNDITFTPEKLERLRGAHNQAVTLKQKQFEFQGNVMVTDFAKYLIQYLDGKFKGSA